MRENSGWYLDKISAQMEALRQSCPEAEEAILGRGAWVQSQAERESERFMLAPEYAGISSALEDLEKGENILRQGVDLRSEKKAPKFLGGEIGIPDLSEV